MNSVTYSSKTDQWSTPQDFFDELNNEFNFDLDPCADELNHKCQHFFTKEQNGLSKDWEGHCVFCNPPYGKDIALWVEKAYIEGTKANTIVVMLIPARTDTRYFHNFILNRSEIRFIKGRLKFGNSQFSAPFPSMVVIFRGNQVCRKESEMQQDDLQTKVVEQAALIAAALKKGKDVEVRRTAAGISVAEVSKKVVYR